GASRIDARVIHNARVIHRLLVPGQVDVVAVRAPCCTGSAPNATPPPSTESNRPAAAHHTNNRAPQRPDQTYRYTFTGSPFRPSSGSATPLRAHAGPTKYVTPCTGELFRYRALMVSCSSRTTRRK